MALKTRARANVGRRGQRGFTMVQMVVTIFIVAIVTTFAVVQIAAARDHLKLTGATQQFAGYTEKARLDSIRRHGGTFGGGESKVILASTSDYTVRFDRDYNGTAADKNFKLPEGVTIQGVSVTTSAGTETKIPTAAAPVTITFDMHGRTAPANAYRITFTNARGHESVVGITAAGEVSLDRKAITLTAGDYIGNFNGDSARLGPGSSPISPVVITPAAEDSPTPTPTATPTPTPTNNGNGNGGNGNGGNGNNGNGGSTGDGGTSTGGGGTSTGGGGTSTGGGTTTGGTTGGTTPQCTMTVSPANTQATAIALHNGNNSTSKSTTITVVFANAPTGASFTYEASNHLDVVRSGNNITVTVKNGTGNQGLFSVKITPTASGCGAAQTVYINVAQ